jgi:hypothetical protein
MLQTSSLQYVEQEKRRIHSSFFFIWSLSFNESIFHLCKEDVLEVKIKGSYPQQTIQLIKTSS